MKTQTQLDSDLNKTIHVCAVSQRGIYCNSHSAGKFSSVIPTTRDKVLMVYYSLETRVRQGRESLQLQSATSWRLCSPKNVLLLKLVVFIKIQEIYQTGLSRGWRSLEGPGVDCDHTTIAGNSQDQQQSSQWKEESGWDEGGVGGLILVKP